MNTPYDHDPAFTQAVEEAQQGTPKEPVAQPKPAPRIQRKPKRPRRKIKLVEVGVAMAILVIGLAVGLPMYMQAMAEAAQTVAIRDIKLMQRAVRAFATQNGKLPTSLDQVGFGSKVDPWGNPYRYSSFDTDESGDTTKRREDRFSVPVNTDFDLYSMGADGTSYPPLSSRYSRDDIVRAGNGGYIGTARIF